MLHSVIFLCLNTTYMFQFIDAEVVGYLKLTMRTGGGIRSCCSVARI